MNDDRISKHIEFKDSLKAYKEYLSKLNMEAKKKLDNLNNRDLDLMKKILGILDKRDLKKKIKKREEKLERLGKKKENYYIVLLLALALLKLEIMNIKN